MGRALRVGRPWLFLASTACCFCAAERDPKQVVINTWGTRGGFNYSTEKAWEVLTELPLGSGKTLDALVLGLGACEERQCDNAVGWGHKPDTSGNVTLDAMVFDGTTFNSGSVGFLSRVRNAIGVARAVMEHSAQSLLVGIGADEFALMAGFEWEPLSSSSSDIVYEKWRQNECQPNFYREFEGVQSSCPPYVAENVVDCDNAPMCSGIFSQRAKEGDRSQEVYGDLHPDFDATDYANHDTIGMVILDGDHIVCGTTTNGLRHKIHGRVGDSPIPGSGCYADSRVGGAAATGDGDVMLRFSLTARAVWFMELGMSPAAASVEALCTILRVFPTFRAALVSVNIEGEYASAQHELNYFRYSYVDTGSVGVQEAEAIKVTPEMCAVQGLDAS
jgi:N4-(beta-N-acetylglucosaminyl)-L-asparaginase